MYRFLLLILTLCVVLAGCEAPSSANTHRVPSDAATVQEAINSAADGDTILMAPGIYEESLRIDSKSIVLASEYVHSQNSSVIERTILDGGGADYAVRIGPAGGPVTLTGFTIRNADDGITAERPFTLIHCLVTSTTDGIDYEGGGGVVEQCRFVENRDDAIDIDGPTAATIRRNVLADNEDDGIEIRLHPYEGDSLHTIIAENWIAGNGEDGIQIIDYETPTPRSFRVEDNVIANNAMAGIGVMGDSNTTESYEGDAIDEPLVIVNNTIAGNNHGVTGGGRVAIVNTIIAHSSRIGAKNVTGASAIAHTLFYGNGTNTLNVNLDEETILFADPLLTDQYGLAENSPARNAGASQYMWQGKNIVNLSPDQGDAGPPNLGARDAPSLRSLDWSSQSSSPAADAVEITEVFETPRDTDDNVDSPAVWHGPNGEHWLLATAKDGDVIRVHDAATGESMKRIGGEGTGPGQLDRPNGVAVIDDLMIVVERNNRRIQVFSLPGGESLGTFGEDLLRWPYGLTVYAEESGRYVLYVTDMYETPDEEIPPDEELGERIKQFRFSVEGGALRSEHVRSFGETSGPGVLRKVESIWVDPPEDRLLIAEELEGESQIKIYHLNGTYAGESISTKYFPNEAEGIVLYPCGDGGYYLATDQSGTMNTFHVFDRVSLEHVGSFRGETVRSTDGIAVTARQFGPFGSGAFYAVHDDGNTVAFDWTDIARALDLRTDCTDE